MAYVAMRKFSFLFEFNGCRILLLLKGFDDLIVGCNILILDGIQRNS